MDAAGSRSPIGEQRIKSAMGSSLFCFGLPALL